MGSVIARGRPRYALKITNTRVNRANFSPPVPELPRRADGSIGPVLAEDGGWYLLNTGSDDAGQLLVRWFDPQRAILYPEHDLEWDYGREVFSEEPAPIVEAASRATRAEDLRLPPVVAQAWDHLYLLRAGFTPRGLELARAFDAKRNTLSPPGSLNSFFKFGFTPWQDFEGDAGLVLDKARRATQFEHPPAPARTEPPLTDEQLAELARQHRQARGSLAAGG